MYNVYKVVVFLFVVIFLTALLFWASVAQTVRQSNPMHIHYIVLLCLHRHPLLQFHVVKMQKA